MPASWKLMTMLRGRTTLICVTLAIIAVVGVVMSNAQSWPRRLSLGFGAHPAMSGVMQMKHNGRIVIDHSQKGRNGGGSIEYMPGQGDALDFDVAWYDIFEDRGYEASFRLHASNLSLIGASGLADVDIVVGPGADITATTVNPQVAKLIREQNGAVLPTLEEAPDIILAELCANPIAEDSPLLQEFRVDVERYKDSQQRAANDQGRARYIAQNGPVVPRCSQN